MPTGTEATGFLTGNAFYLQARHVGNLKIASGKIERKRPVAG